MSPYKGEMTSQDRPFNVDLFLSSSKPKSFDPASVNLFASRRTILVSRVIGLRDIFRKKIDSKKADEAAQTSHLLL
jgi:hypothetical protein